MKIYGYTSTESEELLELNEVSISANPEILRELSGFLLKCADEIETHKEDWEHEHFSTENRTEEEYPRLIIYNEELS